MRAMIEERNELNGMNESQDRQKNEPNGMEWNELEPGWIKQWVKAK